MALQQKSSIFSSDSSLNKIMDGIIVWDVDYNLSSLLAISKGFDWFNGAEIIYGMDYIEVVKRSSKKKIVLMHWWQYCSAAGDLSWADLIICQSTELIHEPWETFNKHTQERFNNRNIIYIYGGKLLNDPVPADTVLVPNLDFFPRVAMANQPAVYDFESPRPYIFDALFGSNKTWRVELFKYLEQNNLLDKSIVNIEPASNNENPPSYRSPILTQIEELEIKEFRKDAGDDLAKQSTANIVGRCYTGTTLKCWASQVIPESVYRNSWFSIVSESSPIKFDFLTEKTAKCLYGKRIFVCLAAPGHLQLLHQIGFKTFDGIIDESYDLEPDADVRLAMITDQIKFLSVCDPVTLYTKAMPILNHNFEVINNVEQYFIKYKNFIQPHLDRLK